jgi:hypothetical protein
MFGRESLGCLPFVLLLVLVPYGAYRGIEHSRIMNLAPADLDVSGIIYSKEESYGLLGPGVNETGLIVYSLPEQVAQKITEQGVEFFNQVGRRFGSQTSHAAWLETPFVPDEKWTVANTKPSPPPKIADFLEKYGHGITLDPSVEEMVNEAISTPGSFYSYAQEVGLVIVVPRARKAIFTYAG